MSYPGRMTDYTLYYWPLPFRGQFIRAVLAEAEATWDEPEMDEIVGLASLPPGGQPVPFMAPPVLVDHAEALTLAQMPAILAYLGGKHGLMPSEPALAARTHKIVADANDVLDEVTRFGGRSMWSTGEWETFAEERLPRWMEIFEAEGRAHGLTPEGGTMLGTPEPGLADLVTATLWFTMTEKLPALAPMFESHAPHVATLAERVMRRPALAEMRAETDARFGQAWCGGLIEASLREMLG